MFLNTSQVAKDEHLLILEEKIDDIIMDVAAIRVKLGAISFMLLTIRNN